MITGTKDFLNNNPLLGFISGFASWILYLLHEILAICTDDKWLKIVASLGVWATAAVAVLNLAAWIHTRLKRLAKHIKTKRELKKGESV